MPLFPGFRVRFALVCHNDRRKESVNARIFMVLRGSFKVRADFCSEEYLFQDVFSFSQKPIMLAKIYFYNIDKDIFARFFGSLQHFLKQTDLFPLFLSYMFVNRTASFGGAKSVFSRFVTVYSRFFTGIKKSARLKERLKVIIYICKTA